MNPVDSRSQYGTDDVPSSGVLNGLQCTNDLVIHSIEACDWSRNSQCESKVSRNPRSTEVVCDWSRDSQCESNASHRSSCGRTACDKLRKSQCESKHVNAEVMGSSVVCSSKHYKDRFIYNSRLVPRQVEALLAKKCVKNSVKCYNVKRRTVCRSNDSAFHMYPVCKSKTNKCCDNNGQFVDVNEVNGSSCEVKVTPVVVTPGKQRSEDLVTKTQIYSNVQDGVNPVFQNKANCSSHVSSAAKVISDSEEGGRDHIQWEPHWPDGESVNSVLKEGPNSGGVALFDINDSSFDDKFANSILNFNQLKKGGVGNLDFDSEIFKKWRRQSAFDFGFIPIDEQAMPVVEYVNEWEGASPWDVHDFVKATGVPNFLKARIPIISQLNVQAWKDNLKGYWNQQLLQLLQFGFPLDFNRNCDLKCDKGNHKSALETWMLT